MNDRARVRVEREMSVAEKSVHRQENSSPMFFIFFSRCWASASTKEERESIKQHTTHRMDLTAVNPVWTFCLSQDENFLETNSPRLVRFSIWPPNRKEALLASETCRQLMEGCPEWMIKVARRVQQRHQQRTGGETKISNNTNKRSYAVRIVYDRDVETILLVDGAQLPTPDQQIPTVHMGLFMAASEKSYPSKMNPIIDNDVLVSLNSSSK